MWGWRSHGDARSPDLTLCVCVQDLIVKLLVRSPNIRHVDLDGNRPAWPILQSFCDGCVPGRCMLAHIVWRAY